MSSMASSSKPNTPLRPQRPQRRTGPFRLFTPSGSSDSNDSPPPDSPTSASSAAPSRSPSPHTSDTSSTTDDELPAINGQRNHFIGDNTLADDTDAPSEFAPAPRTISEAIRLAKSSGDYYPPDHFLAPPTPEQLRRHKKKPKRLLYTTRTAPIRKPPTLYVDEKIQKQLLAKKLAKPQDLGLETAQSIQPPKLGGVKRELYSVNTKEFKVSKILERVYKPSFRRIKYFDLQPEGGIGIGGYIIEFEDGHQTKIPIDRLDIYLKRYPGLDELLEEFEHVELAKEDQDVEALRYFMRQRALRQGLTLDGNDDTMDVD